MSLFVALHRRRTFRLDVAGAALFIALACNPLEEDSSASSGGSGAESTVVPCRAGGPDPSSESGGTTSSTGAGGEGPGSEPGITGTGGDGDGPVVLGCNPPVLGERPLTPSCGDGFLDFEEPGFPGEECDDGNVEPGDGCTEECRIEPMRIGASLLIQATAGARLGPGRHPLSRGITAVRSAPFRRRNRSDEERAARLSRDAHASGRRRHGRPWSLIYGGPGKARRRQAHRTEGSSSAGQPGVMTSSTLRSARSPPRVKRPSSGT